MMSKGSKRRPRQTSREEEDLRMDLAYGKISRLDFNVWMRILKKNGKITRSGKVIQ